MNININNMNFVKGNAEKFGTIRVQNGIEFTCELTDDEMVYLNLYDENEKPLVSVCMNDFKYNSMIASVIVSGYKGRLLYEYSKRNEIILDPYASLTTGARKYKDTSDKLDKAVVLKDDYNWEDDTKPNLSFDEVIAYQLHVRGFTKHSSSKVVNKGTFLGLIEKIDYLKNLGINQVVLMPCYEFNEVEKADDDKMPSSIQSRNFNNCENKCFINYWGFKAGQYFVPKANYAVRDASVEFKNMVKSLHKAGIEVVMRFYFPEDVRKSMIPEILRFWVKEYHVDGFFVMGHNIPLRVIAQDLYLADVKLYFSGVEANVFEENDCCNKHIAVVNSDFMNVSRRFLKSDENMLDDFLYHQRFNPDTVHVVNYITDYCGFTLNDLVSFDFKHNENNNEDNKDGENYNNSWNCGVEGYTKRKAINDLRMKQIKNALVFLIFAQGVPMLLAGDEFLNGQNGNNNPYCQDNETGWLVWKNNKQTDEVSSFVRSLIMLRKSHMILHLKKQFKIMDYASCGFPDLSYHSDSAWSAKFDNYLRHVGLMMCGKYAKDENGKEDDFFYIAYNMHWQPHELALPKLPKGLKWDICIDTSSDDNKEVEHMSGNAGMVNVKDRSVVILKSVIV